MYFFISIFLFTTPLEVEEFLNRGDIERVEKECKGLEDEMFFMGEAKFFQADFDSALYFYKEVSISSSYANDAVFRRLLIKEIKKEALSFYTQAELTILRGDFKKGIKYIEEGISSDSSSLGYAALLFSMAYKMDKNLPMAVQVLMDVQEMENAGIFGPYLLLKAGGIYEEMERYDEAGKVYERLIVEFPDFPFVPLAEERIKQIP